MKRHLGMVTLDTLIVMSVYLVLGVTLLSGIYLAGDKIVKSTRIEQNVESIKRSAEQYYLLAILKSGQGSSSCLTLPKQPTISDLQRIGLSSDITPSSYSVTFKAPNNSLPTSIDIMVTFASSQEKDEVINHLSPTVEQDSSLIFSYPLSWPDIDYLQFNSTTRCYQP
ncbi:hypothetical protein ETN89_19630 (plasmid) [Photobacterium damselae subsp. damselae]|uniref:hypothetical protein n=1 Tax=Photobacterium damselae TaxID=38293 RepID=UPI000A2FE460|nr:hypothetical protein [Photobacterium damselae]ARR51795.1 hypothetical protein CAY62_20480 [Photobacterium damselae subsp. damselae]QAY37480.1 hypothetical protein ETN89_19630 [Photobacterium damselae subsp. damselae]